jgi:cleavage and polyadenylation specificity factor subunit 1
MTATDPGSRVSVMLLPTNTGGDGALAILPFFQDEIDLDSLGVDKDAYQSGEDLPS